MPMSNDDLQEVAEAAILDYENTLDIYDGEGIAKAVYPIIERQVRAKVAVELRDRAQLQAEITCGNALVRAANAVEGK